MPGFQCKGERAVLVRAARPGSDMCHARGRACVTGLYADPGQLQQGWVKPLGLAVLTALASAPVAVQSAGLLRMVRNAICNAWEAECRRRNLREAPRLMDSREFRTEF